MGILDDLSNLVENEKKRREEELKKNIEEQKKQAIIKKKQKESELENKKFDEFMKNFEYGKIKDTNKNFTNIGKLSFKECLQKAYCKDLSQNDKLNYSVCSNSTDFYPYLAWRRLETQPTKGTCLIGTKENDNSTFKYIGEDALPVYITPVKPQEGINIADNLDKRENEGKINIIKRLQSDLGACMKNLLYEKNRNEINKDNNIKNNYTKLSNLDKTILTLTQKIKQNNSRYLLNNDVSYILIIIVGIIAFILASTLIYYSIKYTRNIYNIN